MAHYKFTGSAERDLENIIDYTAAQRGALQAHIYLDGLETQGQLLADNPDIGIDRESISEGLFSFPYESHILYYFKQAHGITITRVLHNRMDPMKHL
ncbi:MAG: type II toxin-antitoxin system RelE/ParE family toxin [Candidatus Polarisedimenticolaceae bacterium]|nr:type II toxin-antitoxin system RelE/ParE family toxin [Candidatus Polarisedimenticolaceae bacterium]